MKEEYGLFVWPCSIVLAEYVWQQRLRFSGATVVEVMSEILFPILAFLTHCVNSLYVNLALLKL